MLAKRKRLPAAHPHRDCTEICGAKNCLTNIANARTYHVWSLPENRREFSKALLDINSDTCLCGRCYNRASTLWQQHNSPQASPDAPPPEKKQAKVRELCILNKFQKCQQQSRHSTECNDWNTFVVEFELQQLEITPYPTLELCPAHYMQWYRAQRQNHCGICKKKFKGDMKLCTIPDFQRLHAYFVEQGDIKATLQEQTKVCLKCYHSLLKLKAQLDTISFSDAFSSDEDISSLLSLYRGYVSEPANLENAPLHHAIVYCLQNLLKHIPFLLSDVYGVYRSHIDAMAGSSRVAAPAYMTQATLLSKLLTPLSTHMRHSTVSNEPSLGTVLWRAGDNTADLLLRQLNAQKKSYRQSGEAIEQEIERISGVNEETDILQQAAVVLRNDIKDLSTDFKGKTRTQDFSKFAVSEVVKSVPPRMWNFFIMLTESQSQKSLREQTVEHNWFHDNLYRPVAESDANHRQLLRVLFQICHIIYTFDDRCGYPLHTLLGEAVHGLGGADELVRILNRFGIISSLSKIRSHELDVMYTKLKYGWNEVFTKGAFCFVSIDNVDKASSHASVKASGGQRGIHATSYQLVEPNPSSLKLLEGEPSPESGSESIVTLPENVTVKDILEIRKQARPTNVAWSRSHTTRPYGRLADFQVVPEEQHAVDETTSALLAYGVVKAASSLNPATENTILHDLNLVCPRPHIPKTEKSKVYYLGVLNEHADNISTIKEVVETIHQEVVTPQNMETLIVVGDGKTYFHLVKLKQEYDAELGWMLPFPGDWHTLKNLQPVLMKIYWHAGLADVAGVVHKGATHNSVYQCSNFRRTHDFILLSWEALLRTQLLSFQKYITKFPNANVKEGFMETVSARLATLDIADAAAAPKVLLEVWSLIGGEEFASEFSLFRRKMAADEVFRFWDNFVHRDALIYIMMFVAMRTGNWSLRLGALKLMAPLFHAFDRTTYLKLIPRHLLHVLQMPQGVLTYLKNGGFVASLKGTEGRNVAADECHEMKINKEVKMAMSKPVPSMMDRLALLLPYRATAVEKLKEEVHSREKTNSSTEEAINMEAKVKMYVAKVQETTLSSSTPPEGPVPLQTLSGQLADPTQREDMLTFYEIGSQSFESYISTRILGQPSVEAPHRKKRLKTFMQKQRRQSKVSLKAKNRKLVNRCLRKIIVHSKTTSQPIETLGQFIKLPLAVANPKGTMVHGNKANSTKVYKRRYPMAFTKTMPPDWRPQCVILEGMFLINSSPLRSATVYRDYTQHVLRNFVLPRYAFGAKEVHVAFDDPGRNGVSPKDLERERRDDGAVLPVTTCPEVEDAIEAHTELPDRSTQSWRQAVLEDRVKKRKLVNFLAKDLLEVAKEVLKDDQKLVTAGGFDGDMKDKAMVATKEVITVDESLSSNHEESDSRVWLHCLKTTYSRVLVYSPDTDTYHVGLRALIGQGGLVRKDAVVQLSMVPDDHEYLSIPYLASCLRTDPDLDLLIKDDLPTVFQALYVASGCDYTSFFFGCGKASFLSAFFMYASFINGRTMEGSLSDSDVESEGGLCAFYRLVGCVYFQKFSSVMPHEHKTPRQLFQSFSGAINILQQHKEWLDCVRDHSWEKIDSEEEVMPSNDALKYHWRRCCWVLHLWGQAGNQDVTHENVTEYGYMLEGGSLSVLWDSPSNMQKVDDLVQQLTTGCKCKSGCSTRRCSCNKNHKVCSAGCACCNCMNPHKDGSCLHCHDASNLPTRANADLQDLASQEDDMMPELQPDDIIVEYETDDNSNELSGDDEAVEEYSSDDAD